MNLRELEELHRDEMITMDKQLTWDQLELVQTLIINKAAKEKKPYFTVHKSKKHPGQHRIVQWFGIGAAVWVETVEDNIGYGAAHTKIQHGEVKPITKKL